MSEKEKQNRIIVTVLGKDKVGIIAGITGVLADLNANILDIRQTIMQEFFTMIMIVDISKCRVDFDTLLARLQAKGEELGVKVNAQHEDVFSFMHRI
ncbi:MAG: hypothetical protein PWQ91_1158 [Eubacteriales bacterium]|nr:hypothetical protein [Eubacteriales bacterium]